jgi:hypothetical protein
MTREMPHLHLRAGASVESGDTFEEPVGPDFWDYFATVAVASGTTVIVQAVATDHLGGVGVLSQWTTIP